MAKQVYSVNFLRGQGSDFVDKFIKWMLTVGRLLIIITETAALSAFAYRLTIDWQIIDLHDKIKQQQIIVSLLQPNEKLYRGLQKELAQISSLDKTNAQSIKLFHDIIIAATGNITFTTYSQTENQLHMVVSAKNPSGVSRFVDALKQDKDITNISVDNVQDDKAANALTVSISAEVKKL